ncbi:MAG: carboxypeptidase-like regulatory domain-containing protein [Kiritimatiellae bacterium]|nr:carboxypeptidase-like regulatory domain-containing protein [Kiritimatiellia bacterium]
MPIVVAATQLCLPTAGFTGSIQGTVRDEFDDPVALTWVDAYDAAGLWAGSGLTDFDGSYEIASLPNGVYYVRTFILEGDLLDEWFDDVPVRGLEIPATATPLTVTEGIISNINFVLSLGGAITGRVTDASGAGLGNVWIDAYDVDGNLIRSTLSEATGSYRIRGLPAGSYYLRTAALGLNQADEWFDDIPVVGSDIPEAATVITVLRGSATGPCNFALATGAILTGRVTTSEGTPLAGVWVDAYDESGLWMKSTATASDGSYQIEGLPSVTCCVRTYTTAGNYADEWFDDVPVKGFDIPPEAKRFTLTPGLTISNVNFSLSLGATVFGTVTDSGGTPLVGIRIHLYDKNGEWLRSTITGSNGAFVIQRLSAGDAFLRTDDRDQNYVDEWFDNIPVIFSGIPPNATALRLTPGMAVGPLFISLERGAIVEGQVTAEDGTPLEGVGIAVYRSDIGPVRTGETTAGGHYRIQRLPAPGVFFVRTRVAGLNYVDEWYDGVPVRGTAVPPEAIGINLVPGASVPHIDFALRVGGIVRGLVSGPTGPLADVAIHFFDSQTNWIKTVITSPNGSYTANGLNPATSYWICTDSTSHNYVDKWYANVPVMGHGIPAGAFPVAVYAGLITDNINFSLEPGAVLEGFVGDVAGSPIVGVWVDLYLPNGAWVKGNKTDGSGHYEIAKLPPLVVFTRTYSSPLGFLDKWYPDVPVTGPEIPVSAVPVALSNGMTTNAHFILDFFVTSCTFTNSRFRLEWQAASGTTYRVLCSSNLFIWTNAPSGSNPVERSIQTADSQKRLGYEDMNTSATLRFYRVHVVME